MTDNDFRYIADPIVRAWNRWVTAAKMFAEGNTEGAIAYLEQFDDAEKLKIGYTNYYVGKVGYDKAVRWVQDHAKFTDDDKDEPSYDILTWGEAVSLKTADKEQVVN